MRGGEGEQGVRRARSKGRGVRGVRGNGSEGIRCRIHIYGADPYIRHGSVYMTQDPYIWQRAKTLSKASPRHVQGPVQG